MTPEEMQQSIHRVMGRFYQFWKVFHVGLNILSFPILLLYLHNIKRGWWKWYRGWRNSLKRFGGWLILRGRLAKFRRDPFSIKLGEAKRQVVQLARSSLRM